MKYEIRMKRKAPEQFTTVTIDALTEEQARRLAVRAVAKGEVTWQGDGKPGRTVVVDVKEK
jgi:hypothetical protein